MNRLKYHRPAKQRRALLESNSPRDSWIERRRNKTVSTFGEAITSPKASRETFISEPEHAFLKLIQTVSQSSKSLLGSTRSTKQRIKNYLSWYPFFRSKRTAAPVLHFALCTIVPRRAPGYCHRSSLPMRWTLVKRQQTNMNETISVRPPWSDKPP